MSTSVTPPFLEAGVVEAFGVRLGVRSTEPGTLEKVESRLPEDLTFVPHDVAFSGVELDGTLSLVVDGGARVLLGQETVALAEDPAAGVDRLVPEIQLFLHEFARTHAVVHAGVVGVRGEAVVLPGRSFAGKSALVAALVAAGATYYSDELAVFDEHGRVHPFRRPLGLRLEPGRPRAHVPVEELGGRAGQEPLPLGLVLVTRYVPGAPFAPKPMQRSEAYRSLVRHAIGLRRRPDLVTSILSRAVAGAHCWASKRGEAAPVAEFLMQQAPSTRFPVPRYGAIRFVERPR